MGGSQGPVQRSSLQTEAHIRVEIEKQMYFDSDLHDGAQSLAIVTGRASHEETGVHSDSNGHKA